jgi:hypothetical protein
MNPETWTFCDQAEFTISPISAWRCRTLIGMCVKRQAVPLHFPQPIQLEEVPDPDGVNGTTRAAPGRPRVLRRLIGA